MTKTEIKSITFLFPSTIAGGIEFLFIRLAKYLLKNTQIKIYYIDYKDGFAKKILSDSNVEFIEFSEDSKINIDFETCIILPTNQLLFPITHLNAPEKTKLLFWSLQAYDLFWIMPGFRHFTIHVKPKREQARRFLKIVSSQKFSLLQKTIAFLHQNKGFVDMDSTSFDTNNYCLSLNLDKKNYLPVSAKEVSCKPNYNLIHKDIINIAWLGRLVDFKVNPLIKIIQDANAYSDKYNKKIKIHIIGTGNQENLVKKTKTSDNVELIFLGTIIEDELNNYLIDKTDVLFAMGTSCLEGAKLNVPSVLMDSSYCPIGKQYKYKWLFESFEYTLGEEAEEAIANKHPFESIIEQIYVENKKEFIGKECYEYFIENHSVKATADKLLNYLQNDDLTYEKFINSDASTLCKSLKQRSKINKSIRKILYCINIAQFWIKDFLKWD